MLKGYIHISNRFSYGHKIHPQNRLHWSRNGFETIQETISRCVNHKTDATHPGRIFPSLWCPASTSLPARKTDNTGASQHQEENPQFDGFWWDYHAWVCPDSGKSTILTGSNFLWFPSPGILYIQHGQLSLPRKIIASSKFFAEKPKYLWKICGYRKDVWRLWWNFRKIDDNYNVYYKLGVWS